METISRYLLTFLLNSLWQVPLAAAVAWLACRSMRNGPAVHRHAVWVAALAASVILPLASIRRDDPAPALQFAAPVTETAFTVVRSAPRGPLPAALAPSPAPVSRTISLAETTVAVLLGAYFLFVLFQLARLWRASARTIQMRHAAHAAELPELLRRVWSRCQRAFGLYDVELFFSDIVSGPVTAANTIILPEFMRAEESEDVLTTAIGHEMAHIARRDFSSNFFYELLRLPLAFQPAIWLIRRGIESSREMACDDLVTGRLIDAGAYARSIMSIAAGMTAPQQPAYTLGVLDGDILEERIRRLVARPASNLKRARLLLATGLAALAACAVVASSLAFTARAQDGASDLLKQAAAAYNRGDYPEAARQFGNAVAIEPSNVKAKLYLAQALLRQSVPGARPISPVAALAQQQYRDVLAIDPRNKAAFAGLMTVSVNTRQFADAHDWALKAIQADPTGTGAYYTAAFADWSMTYPDYAAARAASGMQLQDQGMIPDVPLRLKVRDAHAAQLEDGFHMLQTALQLDPGYSDAMAYMNLLYRIQAGISDTPEQAAENTAKANDWVAQALAAKRAAALHPPPASKADADGLLSGPSPSSAPPPPPPPPPPPSAHAGTNQDGMPPGQIAVGGRVQAAKLIAAPPPVYPAGARNADVSGEVVLNVLIDKDGSVLSAQAVSGDPMLTPAAIQAVSQWKYSPTLLNLNPVQVKTQVSVVFTLANQ